MRDHTMEDTSLVFSHSFFVRVLDSSSIANTPKADYLECFFIFTSSALLRQQRAFGWALAGERFHGPSQGDTRLELCRLQFTGSVTNWRYFRSFFIFAV